MNRYHHEENTTMNMTMKELLDRTTRVRWMGQKSECDACRNAAECVRALGEHTEVRRITTRKVNDAKGKWRLEGAAPGTINRRLAALSTMLMVAEREGAIKVRPHIDREREPEGRNRFLSEAERAALFTALGGGYEEGWCRSMAIVLSETGMRVGEALRLRWEDVRSDSVTLRLTKGGRARTVPLTATASAALLECSRAAAGPFIGKSQSVFNKAWNVAKDAAGLAGDKNVVPHILRHTCASRLVQGGVHLMVVKEWLGHADVKTTLRYSHLDTSALQIAAKVLA